MNRRFIFRMRPTICRRAKRGGNTRAAVAYDYSESEHLVRLSCNTLYSNDDICVEATGNIIRNHSVKGYCRKEESKWTTM